MEGLIRGVTQVSRKRWAYLREAYTRGDLYAEDLQAEEYGILFLSEVF